MFLRRDMRLSIVLVSLVFYIVSFCIFCRFILHNFFGLLLSRYVSREFANQALRRTLAANRSFSRTLLLISFIQVCESRRSLP